MLFLRRMHLSFLSHLLSGCSFSEQRFQAFFSSPFEMFNFMCVWGESKRKGYYTL